jgi:hypothetical protein
MNETLIKLCLRNDKYCEELEYNQLIKSLKTTTTESYLFGTTGI